MYILREWGKGDPYNRLSPGEDSNSGHPENKAGVRMDGVIQWILSYSFNPLKTKRRLLYLKTQSVPRCKHFSSRL